jgi:hypothetical protein
MAQGTSQCNCSICAKARFWKAVVKADGLRLLQGKGSPSDHTFGSHSRHHLFCRRGGVTPFGRGQWKRSGARSTPSTRRASTARPRRTAQAPARYEDGRNDPWESVPTETRPLSWANAGARRTYSPRALSNRFVAKRVDRS